MSIPTYCYHNHPQLKKQLPKRFTLECGAIYTVEYEDETFNVGEEVTRVSSWENGQYFPEIKGRITHVYRDGVRVIWMGIPFYLSKATYGQHWLYAFDFRHLEYIVRTTYRDTKHISLLIEGWGERLVLAAAVNAGTTVSLKVIEICIGR
jgi:hypothetical protein